VIESTAKGGEDGWAARLFALAGKPTTATVVETDQGVTITIVPRD
jgi:hypothetical protein